MEPELFGRLEAVLLEVCSTLPTVVMGDREYGIEFSNATEIDDAYNPPGAEDSQGGLKQDLATLTEFQLNRKHFGTPVVFGMRRKIEYLEADSSDEYCFSSEVEDVKNTDVNEDNIDSLIRQPHYECVELPTFDEERGWGFLLIIDNDSIRFDGLEPDDNYFLRRNGSKELLALNNEPYNGDSHKKLVAALKLYLAEADS